MINHLKRIQNLNKKSTDGNESPSAPVEESMYIQVIIEIEHIDMYQKALFCV